MGNYCCIVIISVFTQATCIKPTVVSVPGKQVSRDSLDLFCGLCYRSHKNLTLALKRDRS